MARGDSVQPKIFSAVFMLVVLLVAGTAFYHHFEGWNFLDSLYFTTVTMTTVGYGDLAPVTASGKIFTIFFSIIGVSLFLFFAAVLASHYFMKRIKQTEERVKDKLNRKVEESEEKVKRQISRKLKKGKS